MATVTLTFGAYTDLKGRTAFAGMKGTLSSTAPIVNTTTGAVMWEPVDFVIDSDGTAEVDGLVPNDDPSVVPGTEYVVTWNVASYKPSPGNRTFVIPTAAGATVDFDLLSPTTPGAPYSLPLVVSVNGDSGAVTLSAADVGADAAGAATAAQAFARQRANHTGTQTAATISDLGAAVAADATVKAAFDAAGAASSAQSAATSAAASDATSKANAAQAASLQKSSNLGDLVSASTARTNLGLGTAAIQPASAFDAAGAAAAAVTANAARVFPLSRSFASTDASPVDATAHIQSVLDACASAGGGIVYIPGNCTFFHTYNELGDYTILRGDGRSSVIKQMPGITYSSGTVPTGSYGLTCKTALHAIGLVGFAYDGNAAASADAATQFNSAFDGSGNFVVGQLKCANIAIDRLNRGTLSDGTWVSPDYVYLDQVWSTNGVRSCFLFQMSTNRSTAGVVQAGALYAENSAIDHLLYAAESEQLQISSFVGKGYWRGGAFAVSGGKFDSVSLLNLAANPYNNTTHSFDFESEFCIDDRSDDKGGVFGGISLRGDLALLGGTDTTRDMFRARGYGSQIQNVQIEHTGTDPDLVFRILVAENGAGSGGTQEGPAMTGLRARNMPGRTRIFSHDPNAWGGNLIGGQVSDVYMTIIPGAAPQATALFDFHGLTAEGFTARDVFVEVEDYTTRGPSAIYENACTTSFVDADFENIIIRRGTSTAQPWIDATTNASNVRLAGCRTYGTQTPTRPTMAAVESIRDCILGSTKVSDSRLDVIGKTADQSVTSSTTLASDSTLSTWLRANATYVVEVCALVDADATGSIQTSFSAPSGSTVQRGATGVTTPMVSGTAVEVIRTARVTTSTTPNLLIFTWAQKVSSATATTVKAGSYMTVRRIS